MPKLPCWLILGNIAGLQVSHHADRARELARRFSDSHPNESPPRLAEDRAAALAVAQALLLAAPTILTLMEQAAQIGLDTWKKRPKQSGTHSNSFQSNLLAELAK